MAGEPSIIDVVPSPPPPNSSTFLCFMSENSIILFSTDMVTYALLILPFYVFLCFLGLLPQKQRRPHTWITHSDHFTFQSIFMQLIEFFGFVLLFCGEYTNDLVMVAVAMSIIGVTSTGQALFHLCTCVERYVAVVHPITYLGLRPSTRVRIRNVTIGCVWIISLGTIVQFLLFSYMINVILYYCVVFMTFTLVCFCCISVLCALRRPGPGSRGGATKQVDQSKKKAFCKIMVIMMVLLTKFISCGLCIAIYSVLNSEMCMMFLFGVNFWFMLPSYLMLPLLFIHRTMKLQRLK